MENPGELITAAEELIEQLEVVKRSLKEQGQPVGQIEVRLKQARAKLRAAARALGKG